MGPVAVGLALLLLPLTLCVPLATQEARPFIVDDDAIVTSLFNSNGDTNMTRVLFANAESRKAQCNDGSPAGYYISRSSTGSKKWILYLIGGGLCYDEHTCRQRNPVLTSSKTWPESISPMGIFTSDPSSKFADYNKVMVCYCTSDLYSGTAEHSGLLGFRFFGKHIVPAVLQDLDADLRQASDVLFCGGSAGGIGTFMNYPMVKQYFDNYGVPVKAMPDAGWFLTTMPVYDKKRTAINTMLDKGMPLWKGQVPKACADALGDKQMQCYSGPVVYNFMPGPKENMLVLKAETDAWTLGNDGIKSPFTSDEVKWIMELAAMVRTTFTVDNVTNVFSADCVYHTAIDNPLYNMIKVNGMTMQQAVESWYFDGALQHQVDACTTPMCNPTCV